MVERMVGYLVVRMACKWAAYLVTNSAHLLEEWLGNELAACLVVLLVS